MRTRPLVATFALLAAALASVPAVAGADSHDADRGFDPALLRSFAEANIHLGTDHCCERSPLVDFVASYVRLGNG